MASDKTSVVILGASGDLAKRKLIPALFELYRKGRLPADTQVLGFARTDYSDDAFREYISAQARDLAGVDDASPDWRAFVKRVHYQHGSLSAQEDLINLRHKLVEVEDGDPSANRLFYLSIAPNLYEDAVMGLATSGLAAETGGWRRLVIEKPFGRDLRSAQELNESLLRVFREDQVYRIDHYLGKETVQNLLVFRFGNAIFEPVWNRNYVDNVQITVAESVDLAGRAGYYDTTGATRDMLQNHLLQLVALVAMEPPPTSDPETLRNMRVESLKAIRRWSPEGVRQHAVRGRYRGYADEPGVAPDSPTATYIAVRLFIDNWRWEGVPFYVRTGKALARKESEIVVQFKRPPQHIFEGSGAQPNVLSFCLQPDEGALLRFSAKVPDQGMSTRPVDMAFHYGSAFPGEPIPDAYERLLQDAIEGDPSLFIRSDQIEESWRIVEPLLEGAAPAPLRAYDRGSWGPDAADALLAQRNHAWLRVCGHGDRVD